MKIVLMWLTHNLGVLPQLMKTAIWYQMIGDIVPRLAQLCDIVLAEQVKFMFFEKANKFDEITFDQLILVVCFPTTFLNTSLVLFIH